MRVVVELIAARIDGDGIRFIRTEADIPRRSDPEATARAELARLFPTLWLRRTGLHSTGWRFADGHIFLSYLGYSDDFALSDLPLVLPLAHLGGATGAPGALVAHAVRHLAFLVREDPATYKKGLRSGTIAALMKMAPALAGRQLLKGAA